MEQYIIKNGKNIALISFIFIFFSGYAQVNIENVSGVYKAQKKLGYKNLVLKDDGTFLEYGKEGRSIYLGGTWKLKGKKIRMIYDIPKKRLKSKYLENNCSYYPISDSVNILVYDDLLRPVLEYDSIGYYDFSGNHKFIQKSSGNGFYLQKDSFPSKTAFFFRNHERLEIKFKGGNCLHMYLKRDIYNRFSKAKYRIRNDTLYNKKFLPYVKIPR